ncbi:hypothetical protein E2C01_043323 [Portunus trituberculatus]|uniref:Uncharacterized protein n=1 Tax=Portunus trituberculatus TaxID=210409 RepID=A0A5B7FQ02_PORTR|nr:hypothetical protein [Portunus trituberculatus]
MYEISCTVGSVHGDAWHRKNIRHVRKDEKDKTFDVLLHGSTEASSNSTSSGGAVNPPLKVVMITLNVSLCVSQLKGAVTACPLKTTLLLRTELHAT